MKTTSSASAIVEGRDAIISTVDVQRRAEPVEDRRLGRGIERRGGVVEDQDRRSPHERPRERDPLALSPTEADAALADDRVESGRQRADEVVAGSDVQCRPHLVIGCILAEHDVVADAPGHQERLLEHDRAWTGASATVPSVAGTNPTTTSASVDLPDPVGPTSAVIDPAGSDRSTSCSDARSDCLVGESDTFELDPDARSGPPISIAGSSITVSLTTAWIRIHAAIERGSSDSA